MCLFFLLFSVLCHQKSRQRVLSKRLHLHCLTYSRYYLSVDDVQRLVTYMACNLKIPSRTKTNERQLHIHISRNSINPCTTPKPTDTETRLNSTRWHCPRLNESYFHLICCRRRYSERKQKQKKRKHWEGKKSNPRKGSKQFRDWVRD